MKRPWCLSCLDIYESAGATPGFIDPEAFGFGAHYDPASDTTLCGRCRRVMRRDGRSFAHVASVHDFWIDELEQRGDIRTLYRKGERYALRSELYAALVEAGWYADHLLWTNPRVKDAAQRKANLL